MERIEISTIEELENSFHRFIQGEAQGIIHLSCLCMNPVRRLRNTGHILALASGYAEGQIEQLIYYTGVLVTDPGKSALKKMQIVNVKEYNDCIKDIPADERPACMTGAEAVEALMNSIDFTEELNRLHQKEIELMQHHECIMDFADADDTGEPVLTTDNEEMLDRIYFDLSETRARIDAVHACMHDFDGLFIDHVRLFPLEMGRYIRKADALTPYGIDQMQVLYNRVLVRSNRLKMMVSMSVPEVILTNEKRMLQMTIDDLLANGEYGEPYADFFGEGNDKEHCGEKEREDHASDVGCSACGCGNRADREEDSARLMTSRPYTSLLDVLKTTIDFV